MALKHPLLPFWVRIWVKDVEQSQVKNDFGRSKESKEWFEEGKKSTNNKTSIGTLAAHIGYMDSSGKHLPDIGILEVNSYKGTDLCSFLRKF